MDFSLCILVGKGEGETIHLAPGAEYLVGRHAENDIVIPDQNVSRHHLRIQIKDSRYFITDLHSKNGTFVGGQDLTPGIPTQVNEGVPIVIGTTVLGFGGICQACLKPLLDSGIFYCERDECVGEIVGGIEWNRIASVKKNLALIYNLNNELMGAKDLKEISGKLLDTIFHVFKKTDRCVILTVDDKTKEIRNITYRSRKTVDDPERVYNRELVEYVLMIKRPMMINSEGSLANGEDALTESLQIMKIRSALCVPIVDSYGIKGAIYLDCLERPDGFRKEDLALLVDISGRAALAMENVFLHSLGDGVSPS
ncbi:MAG: FHA domain-containing protein [Deltaproteobacteria bacterium]|nr:FHA domain-containing protein [Deltaproteobacteria bacterium]